VTDPTPLRDQSIEQRRRESEEFRANVQREKTARAEREQIAAQSTPGARTVFLLEAHVIPLLTEIRDALRASPDARTAP